MQVSFNFMTAVTICSDFGAKKIKSPLLPIFPLLFAMKWWDWMPWLCFMIGEFQANFFSLLFHLIKRFFSPSSLSASRVVFSAYVRLLILLPTVLIPACDSSSPACHMIYSACKLNKQGDNIQPCWTPFPILNQSIVPCLVLTVASWPACKFFRRQVRWFGIPISLRIFLSLLWSTQTKALA